MALVTLQSYRDPIDAELDKARLDAAGIPSVTADENLVSVDWLYSNAVGGVKLKVDGSDLDLARSALSRNDSSALAGVNEVRLPPADGDACPLCGSSNVHRSPLLRRSAAISLGIGFPLIAWRRRWICADCKHSWKPTAVQTFAVPEETIEAECSVQERRSYPGLRGFLLALLGLAILYYLEQRIRHP